MFLDMHGSSKLHLTEVLVSDGPGIYQLLTSCQRSLVDAASLQWLSRLANLLKCFKPCSKIAFPLKNKRSEVKEIPALRIVMLF